MMQKTLGALSAPDFIRKFFTAEPDFETASANYEDIR